MNQYTIQISDKVYRLLKERAVIENTTPEQVADHLLIQELTPLSTLDYGDELAAVHGKDTAIALAAIQRLTNLFADIDVSGLEQILEDPMLELENADLIPDQS
jgi:hypothetical protein